MSVALLSALAASAMQDVRVPIQKWEPFERPENAEELAARLATLDSEAPNAERGPKLVTDRRLVHEEVLFFRVVRVTTAELVEAGAGMLLAARPAELGAPPAPVTPATITQSARFRESLVCAGVRAVSRDGQAWDAVRIVADPRMQDPAAGRLHHASLPPGVVPALADAILALSTDGGAAAVRLGSFLGGDARAPGCAGA